MSVREGPITPTLYLASSGQVPDGSAFYGELGRCGSIRDVQSYRTDRGWYSFVCFKTAQEAQEAKHYLLQRGFLRQRCSVFFARSTCLIRVPLPTKRLGIPEVEVRLREVFSR